MLNKTKYIALIIMLLFSFCCAQENERDFLYSAEYFDYLIECAEEERNKALEEEKLKEKELSQEIIKEEIKTDLKEEIIANNYEPFKLQIQAFDKIDKYKETYIKEDSKTIIPVAKNLAIIQDTKKNTHKNSFDYFKIITGLEYTPTKILSFSTGMETNAAESYQHWNNRKFYFTPALNFSDKLSLSFYNNLNPETRETYHNIGLSLSPLKSKAMDFRIYGATERTQSGSHTESAGFTTNFYIF